MEEGQRVKAKSQAQSPNEETLVYVFGPLKLQNELMCEFLERSTGLKCKCWEEPFPIISDTRTNRGPLILWDCVDTDSNNLWAKLDVSLYPESLLALFNVKPNPWIYREAINRGVRGIFLKNESSHVFTKGVQAILNGEFWFSRDILTKCLLESDTSSKPLPEAKSRLLTPREQEILVKIASGSTNVRIAKELCISPHTVKTHLYNIYKKINAPNRLQATLWATKNL